jgi:hypothetical protein
MSSKANRFRNLGLAPSLATGLVAAATVFLVACASTPRPTAEIARARTLIGQAAQAGAATLAALPLDEARDKLHAAVEAIDDGNNRLARDRANEAAASAELALARVDSAHARRAAAETSAATYALKRETAHEAEPPHPAR